MTGPHQPETEELVERAARGDDAPRHLLLGQHRDRLKRRVAAHLDRRSAARVRAALEAGSPRDRGILVRRHQEEMSAAEIAAALGITERAAKARHTRALERLRSLLGED